MSDTPYFIHGRQGLSFRQVLILIVAHLLFLDSGVHPRLEVRELAKIPEQWTLFNLSFVRIQEANYRPVAAKFLSLGLYFYDLLRFEL